MEGRDSSRRRRRKEWNDRSSSDRLVIVVGENEILFFFTRTPSTSTPDKLPKFLRETSEWAEDEEGRAKTAEFQNSTQFTLRPSGHFQNFISATVCFVYALQTQVIRHFFSHLTSRDDRGFIPEIALVDILENKSTLAQLGEVEETCRRRRGKVKDDDETTTTTRRSLTGKLSIVGISPPLTGLIFIAQNFHSSNSECRASLFAVRR